MEKSKRTYGYLPSSFPYNEGIRLDAVKEQAHFVLTQKDLREGFVSLGDVQAGNYIAQAKVTLLCFLAEAIHYSQRYRGAHHNTTFVGDNPRVVVTLNYLTRKVFSAEHIKTPLNRDQLFSVDNVVGVLVSVFICDNDLSLADMCSDMCSINAQGLPQFKQLGEFSEAEIHGDAPAPGAVVAPRPDVPGQLLGVKGSRYHFSMDPTQRLRFRETYKRLEDSSFLQVDGLKPLITLLQIWSGTFNYVAQQVSNSHMADIGLHNEYQLRNAFTFAKAMEEISKMPVDKLFVEPNNWFNTTRPGAHGAETFGAPCWSSGVGRPVDSNGEPYGANIPFESGSAPTCLLMPADLFRAARIQNTLLPHYDNPEHLKPDGRSIIRTAQGHNINVRQLLDAVGIESPHEKQTRKKEAEMNRDIFNELFEQVSIAEALLLPKLGNPMQPSQTYLDEVQSLREKGRQLYLSLVSQVASPSIPEGVRFLLSWRLTQSPDLAPLPEHMWQRLDEHGLTSYGQMKYRQLLITESITRTSDTQLFLFSVVWRAAMSVYLPKVGNTLFKEHIQLICAPGTSKSDLINRITSLLIEGTYEVEGGASGMGLVGEHASQRLIDVSHELDGYYAPAEEPKGEAAKIHKMILGCLSEGRKKYKTTVEGIDPFTGKPNRTASRKESDDTSVRIGARNYNTFVAKLGGSAAAMYDRFTQVMQVQIFSSARVSIFAQVLQMGPSSESTAFLQCQQQFRIAQDFVCRYCIAVECGWLPFPEMSLFADVAPLMVGFMSARYPQFHSALRKVGGMKCRALGDQIWDRAWKVLFTPLNPTTAVRHFSADEMELRRQLGRIEDREVDPRNWSVQMGPYEPEKLLTDMAKMMYGTYESMYFVMTERLNEMTNPAMVQVLRHIAEVNSNYFSFGRKRRDTERNSMTQWPVEGGSPDSPVTLTLDGIIAALLQRHKTPDGVLYENAIYKVHVPASESQTNFQAKNKPDAHNNVEIGYNELQLVRENVPPEYEELYETGAVFLDEPVRLDREVLPEYKLERINGVTYYNPNYVKVNSTVYSYAMNMSGIFGDLKLDEQGFIQLMDMASLDRMVTPMLPLIEEKSSPFSTARGLSLIQSLRYIPGAMRHFPKYRLPVLIKDNRRSCFYILISYFETNFRRMCEEMIDFVSYASTPHREILLGIPSDGNRFYYQPYSMKPRPGRSLTIDNKTNVRPETAKIISNYRFDPVTGLGMHLSRSTYRGKTYTGVDIEKERATEYLLRNFPNDKEVLHNFLPDGLERRLRVFYEPFPDALDSKTYAELAHANAINQPLLEDALGLDKLGAPPAFDEILKQRRLVARQLELENPTIGRMFGGKAPAYGDVYAKTGRPMPPVRTPGQLTTNLNEFAWDSE